MIPKCQHCGRPVLATYSPRKIVMAVMRVASLVAAECAVTKTELLRGGKHRAFSEARFLVYWVSREVFGLGTAQIGRALGRHHTTVIHGLRRAEHEIATDLGYARSAQRLVAQARRVRGTVEAAE